MNILLLLLNLVLVLSCSFFLLSLAKFTRKTAYLLGIFILAYADIVLILEVAGLLSALNPATVLTLQFLVTGISALVWRRMGKPNLLGPFSGVEIRHLLKAGILESLRRHPLLVILVVCVAYVYLGHILRILVLPPFNPDSMIYHLSRVGYWMQHESFYPWPTPNPRQVVFPMNAELGLLWTILWWGTDQLSGFVQWMAIPAIMLAIYGLVGLLGYSRLQGLYSAFLWATLTQVIFQSHSTQNDLITASFWVALIYFFFIGLREKPRPAVYLSAIAFGLAIGAKSTSLIVLPGFAIALIFTIWEHARNKDFQARLIMWGFSALLGVLFFGSYIYIQNLIVFHSPLGPKSFSASVVGMSGRDSLSTHLSLLGDNLGRYMYQLVDFSALPPALAEPIQPVKKALFSFIYTGAGISVENQETVGRGGFSLDYVNPINGDNSWFGPLLVFLIPAIVYQLYRGIRTHDTLRLTLAISSIIFFLFFCAVERWTPAKGRYFMIPVALSFPLIAGLFNPLMPGHKLVKSFLILLGITSMLSVALLGIHQLTSSDLKDLFSGQRSDPFWSKDFSYRLILENVPQTASIGLLSHFSYADYPFFGEHLMRRITVAIPDNEPLLPGVDYQRFSQEYENSDYIFLISTKPSLLNVTSMKHFLLIQAPSESLWIRKDLRPAEACDDRSWPFILFYEDSAEAVCPRFPLIMDGYMPTQAGDFKPEIGVGVHQGITFDLVVQQDSLVTFSILLQPRPIFEQTMQFIITDPNGNPTVHSSEFRSGKEVNFVARLQPGVYKIQLFLADGSFRARILNFQVTVP